MGRTARLCTVFLRYCTIIDSLLMKSYYYFGLLRFDSCVADIVESTSLESIIADNSCLTRGSGISR
jgi:hypothetical protein